MIDRDIAEDLVMDVNVQLIQKFRSTQTCVHLQEHQSHFALWGEKGLWATLLLWAIAHQAKVYSHLMQGEKAFHTSKLAVFKRNTK